jgi:hypothetical protein
MAIRRGSRRHRPGGTLARVSGVVVRESGWQVEAIARPDWVVLIASHDYVASWVTVRRVACSLWEGLTVVDRIKSAREMLAAARAGQKNGKKVERGSDPVLEESAPRVAAYLFPPPGPSGEVDPGGTLCIYGDGPVLRVVLIDKATDNRLHASAKTLSDALAALEDCLCAERPDWRPGAAPGRRKR